MLEVDTPLLRTFSVTDPYMRAMQISSSIGTHSGYLQTSPEYAMKELLASGSGDIYQLGKVFRSEESGPHHSEEFTLLEWYRLGFDHHQLMQEIYELMVLLCGPLQRVNLSYQQAFVDYLGVDPFSISLEELKLFTIDKLGELPEKLLFDNYLTLLFSQLIEPEFEKKKITFVHSFPVEQASLAKTEIVDSMHIACRFEVYLQGLEMANGFWELTDAKEQLSRFEKDNEIRKELGYPLVEIDTGLIAALNKGLPECAGVALGFDRLMMVLQNEAQINNVLPMAFTL